MEVIIIFAFVGLGLVACALLLLGNSLRQRDYQHADRLALLPMLEDTRADTNNVSDSQAQDKQ